MGIFLILPLASEHYGRANGHNKLAGSGAGDYSHSGRDDISNGDYGHYSGWCTTGEDKCGTGGAESHCL